MHFFGLQIIHLEKNGSLLEGVLKNCPILSIPGSAFLCQMNLVQKSTVEVLLVNLLILPDVLPVEVIFKIFFKWQWWPRPIIAALGT